MPVTVELGDLSHGGCYFRGVAAPMGAKLAFGFVLPGRRVCVASARVIRVDAGGFAATLDRTNASFDGFMTELGVDPTARAA